MKVYKLANTIHAQDALEKLDVSKGAHSILSHKMRTEFYLIKDMKTPAANILKQDALSIGADVAVPMGTITCASERVDALLIGTQSQIKRLAKKELAQPFGLKTLAGELKAHTRHHTAKVEIMGVLNANEDSFYKASRFEGKEAIKHILSMIEEGADIIDLGGVSSRPGSVAVSQAEELSRVKEIIAFIYDEKLYEKVRFSIDSYAPSVISYALEHGFSMVNDISGLANDDVAKLVGEYDAKAVIMHMQGTPKDMQENPLYDDILGDLEMFFDTRLEKAQRFGIKEIALDVGIGFGKTLTHNLILVKHLEHFKKFGVDLLVGASRKSLIDHITPTPSEDRLAGTLALHLECVKNGANIIRVHDVKAHHQAFAVQKALDDTLF